MNILHECEVIVLDCVDSTNNYIKERGIGEIPTVVIANQQTHGRGTQGRNFFSPPGSGLYMTIGFKPEFDLEHSLTVTRMAGVALRRVLSRFSCLPPLIKPINDIYIDGKKVAGILTEADTCGTGRISAIYVGIGVNCFKSSLPEDISGIAGYIEHPVRTFTIEELAEAVLNEFFELLENFDIKKIIEEYDSHTL